MPKKLVNRALGAAAQRLPALRRLPVAKLLAAGEVALLAREHVSKLDRDERRRLAELLRIGRGRPRNLTPEQREELHVLVAKAEPRMFVAAAADKLSPVPIPQRVVRALGGR